MYFNDSSIDMGNCFLGSDKTPTSVSVTNSGTRTVDAYIYANYDGRRESTGLILSTTYSGTYLSIDDAIFIGMGTDYKISKGYFDNTQLYPTEGGIELVDVSLGIGEYVSQVVHVSDSSNLNTVLLDYDKPANTGVRLYYRLSNKEPLPLEELYWEDSNKLDLNLLVKTSFSSWGITPRAICAYPNMDRIVVSRSDNYISMYDRITGAGIYSTPSNSKYIFDYRMRVDDAGYIYGYNGTSLIKTDAYLQSDDVLEISQYGGDFLGDFAVVTTNISGVLWYTNKLSNTLNLLNNDGEDSVTIYLLEPHAVCSNPDGGCWVFEDIERKAYRYSNFGDLLDTIDLPYPVVVAESDGAGGFWYATEDRVGHMTGAGEELLDLYYPSVARIILGYNKVLLYNYNFDSVHIIDMYTGDLLHVIRKNGYSYRNLPGFLSQSYEEARIRGVSLPHDYDPVWGRESNLSWVEIPIGGLLPKSNYYQFKVELISNNGIDTPRLRNIRLTKGIKLENITPQETRTFYINNRFKDYIADGDYTTNIKCIWINK